MELNVQPGTFVRKPGMDDYKEAHELPELRAHFGFRAQQITPQYFASFDQRLVADAIDYLVVGFVFMLLMYIVYLIAGLNAFRVIFIIGFSLIGLSRLIYGAIAEASVRQATIGKRLMDIKVTDSGGNRLSLGTSFARNFAKIISNLTLGIGYLYCFLNKKQQCLHDVLVDTLVVKDRLI